MVEFLKLKPEIKIEIGGHTDNIGEERANQNLSQDRANSVKKYLVEQGVVSSRLIAKGYAESTPITDNNTEKG